MGSPRKTPKSHGRQDGEGHGGPPGKAHQPELAGRGQQGHRVGADREEGHEAQVEQAGEAQRDVEAEAHQHVERDHGHRLGHELAAQPGHRQDQREDEHAKDDGRDPSRLGGHAACARPDMQPGPGEVRQRGDGYRQQCSREGQALGGEDGPGLVGDVAEVTAQHALPRQAGEEAQENEGREVQDDEFACAAGQERQAGTEGAAEEPHDHRDPEAIDRRVAAEGEQFEELGGGVGQERAQVDRGAQEDEPGKERAADEPHQGAGQDARQGTARRPRHGHVAGRQEGQEQGQLPQRDDVLDQRPRAEDGHDAHHAEVDDHSPGDEADADHAAPGRRGPGSSRRGQRALAVMRGSSRGAHPGCPGAGR